jgi:recombinational DNA repair protein (RecF pathway)
LQFPVQGLRQPCFNYPIDLDILLLSILNFMGEKRLGDVIDDHCIKCRRVTNHSIVSLVEGEAAKVRCRTCYHDHDFRHEQAPPTKKELKKMEADALAAAEAAASGAEQPAPE